MEDRHGTDVPSPVEERNSLGRASPAEERCGAEDRSLAVERNSLGRASTERGIVGCDCERDEGSVNAEQYRGKGL